MKKTKIKECHFERIKLSLNRANLFYGAKEFKAQG
ncbi:Protein of unknown function [Pyronema omphalodes CBS 100304]|uniref:Uncharacterized protein n=1 Tax=Pyronema omphalodes (strain CBS 100304) TaxID=1076935 RepID=U4L7Y1_PYROM|nr:Protein of unknown function [Pyronema omphalodes CBS 100304]